MLIAILAGLAGALAAPWTSRAKPALAGWLLAIVPAGIALYFASFLPAILSGDSKTISYAWAPSLGLNLSFHLDGLSLLFALLISGIGALVFVYAGSYLGAHPQRTAFYAYLSLFMSSMLGLVLADNLAALFVFWELTSISSYLLIGFDHERPNARAAALQALLVTGAGGLAMLAGFVLLGLAGGSLEISELARSGVALREHSHYHAILFLILAGAFTKSAQTPFHFWLPAAMEAPTPVSAYLHSATMVKAGVYLIARLAPTLGGTDAWLYAVGGVGAATMLVGAAVALGQTDLKRILAYSTVSALGLLVLLLGLGTPLGTEAAMVFLLVHSLYKGALFLAAGLIDHETGTRDIQRLGGLGRAMPVTAAATILAALSMAGIPPLFGFIGKELLYEAQLHAPAGAPWFTAAGVAANALLVAVAVMVAFRPFFGPPTATPKHPHEGPFSLWLGPALLAVLGLILGLVPGRLAAPLVSAAASAALGEAVVAELALWHGFNAVLALSVFTSAAGLAVYAVLDRLRARAARLRRMTRWGPSAWYERALDALNLVARAQTALLQNGYLRVYLATVLVTAAGLAGFALLRGGMTVPPIESDSYFYESIVAAIVLAAALLAISTRSRLGAVAALGATGYGVALLFILFGAPDLAMTQFVVESLTVILFVLAFYHLPSFAHLTPVRSRIRDFCIAGSAGGLMALLVLWAVGLQLHPSISPYFMEQSLPQGFGRNVVNVILVDFRAFDTLGEIVVVGIAAIGVYGLLKLGQRRRS
jgi:multicomponent Na+:H+ antiporter subunit A